MDIGFAPGCRVKLAVSVKGAITKKPNITKKVS